jgi:hypothetical protein
MCRQASLTSIPSFVRSSRSFSRFPSLDSNHGGTFGLKGIGVAFNGEQLVGIGALPRPEVLKSEVTTNIWGQDTQRNINSIYRLGFSVCAGFDLPKS